MTRRIPKGATQPPGCRPDENQFFINGDYVSEEEARAIIAVAESAVPAYIAIGLQLSFVRTRQQQRQQQREQSVVVNKDCRICSAMHAGSAGVW